MIRIDQFVNAVYYGVVPHGKPARAISYNL